MTAIKPEAILMKPKVVSRIIWSLTAFVAAFLAMASPGTAPAQETTDTSIPLTFDPRERLQKPDLTSVARVRFLTTVDFPPFNFIDQSGKLSGFHVDLAREICRELDVLERCQIEAVSYRDLTTALEKGEGEVIAAGIRVTPELRRQLSFSRVFMQLPARFLIRNDAAATIRSPSDLKPEELGVVDGTAHQAMLGAFFP